MITLWTAQTRRYEIRRKQQRWRAFTADSPGLATPVFGGLEEVVEAHVPPGAELMTANRRGETITYVYVGSLAHTDGEGRCRFLRAGMFQCVSASSSPAHAQHNPSQTDETRVIQVGVAPGRGEPPVRAQQKHFSRAERKGRLRVVASPDGRSGSLMIQRDLTLCSSLLDVGQHLVHELLEERSAWFYVVRGALALGDLVLRAGDGAGVEAECAASVTALEETELLLLDLANNG